MKRRGVLYGWLAVAVAMLLMGPLALGGLAQQRPSPPLGSVMREFETVTMPGATAYSVYTTDGATPHQVWYRISGGDALFRQRLRVYQENAGPRPINQLPPETERRQEITSNSPTGWFVMPAEQGVFTYYFDGDNRLTANSPWRDAFGVKVKRTRLSNGNRYDIAFEDNESLDDYNDLELQVVIIQPA